MGEVPPEDPTDEWTVAEEFSGRKAFDGWRFAEPDRLVPWDWADMGSHEKRLWIQRAKEGASRLVPAGHGQGPRRMTPGRRSPD